MTPTRLSIHVAEVVRAARRNGELTRAPGSLVTVAGQTFQTVGPFLVNGRPARRGALDGAVASGLVALVDGRYVPTDLGRRAYIARDGQVEILASSDDVDRRYREAHEERMRAREARRGRA
jgi:hypothetical protein